MKLHFGGVREYAFGLGFGFRAGVMRPQLACGRMSTTSLRNLPALPGLGNVAVGGFARALRLRQGKWQRCVVHVARCELQRPLKQVVRGRFAALSQNEAVQFGLNANSSEQGGAGCAGRGEEGLVSTVGTPAPGPVSFQDWYMADKQLVVISFTAFVVRLCSQRRNA